MEGRHFQVVPEYANGRGGNEGRGASPCTMRTIRARAATALASQDYLPQPNEHFAERPPEAWQHDTFEAVDMADGVRSLHARLRDGDDNEPKPATLYFDDDKFTVAEAQTWMHRRGITFASIRASKNATYPQLTS